MSKKSAWANQHSQKNVLSQEEASTSCNCQSPLKKEKYDLVASVAREITKEILNNHEEGRITAKKVMVDINVCGEKQPAHIMFERPEYYIAWTINGVIEVRNNIFTRYIEFNDAYITEAEIKNHQCYCCGNMVDFITLTEICKSIIKRACEFGLPDNKINTWRKQAMDCFKIAESLKQVV